MKIIFSGTIFFLLTGLIIAQTDTSVNEPLTVDTVQSESIGAESSKELTTQTDGKEVSISNSTPQSETVILQDQSKIYKEMYEDSKSTNRWLIGIFIAFLALLGPWVIYSFKQLNNRITESKQEKSSTNKKSEPVPEPKVKEVFVSKENEAVKPQEDESENDEKDESKVKPNLWDSIKLIINNKLEDAEEEFNKYATGKSDIERNLDKIVYLYYRLLKGDENAATRINELISDSNNKEIKSKAHLYLGLAYEDLGSNRKAKEQFEKVLATKDDKNKVIANIRLSNILTKQEKSEEAIDLLRKELISSNVEEDQLKYLIEIDKKLKKLDRNQDRLAVLELANEIAPNNTEILFDLAYNYSELGYKRMSLNCYKKLLSINGENSAAHNNLSILYSEFGLNSYKVKHLNHGMEKGGNFSGPNLALHFLNNGLVEMANEIMSQEKEKGNDSERFTFVQNEISKLVSEHEEKRKTILDVGEKMRTFIQAYASRTLEPTAIISGKYQLNDVVANVEIHEEQITISWRYDDANNYTITGPIYGNSIKGKYSIPHKETIGFTDTSYTSFKINTAFIYKENDVLNVLITDKDEIKNIWRLTRIDSA